MLTTWVASAATVGFLIWANGRGFDITDGGVALLGADHPADVTAAISSAHWLIAVLYRLAGKNVATVRNCGLLLTVVSSLLFYWGLDRTTRRLVNAARERRAADVASEASLVVMGALLGYTWFLPNPSYNWLSAWTVLAASGFFFLGIAPIDDGRPSRTSLSWMVACGLTLVVALLSKGTSALLLSGLLGIALMSWHRGSLRARLMLAAAIGLGAVVMLAAFFFAFQTPSAWWRTLNAGWLSTSQLGAAYGLSRFSRYPREVWDALILGVPAQLVVVSLSFGFVWAFLRMTTRAHRVWQLAASTVVAGLFAFEILWHVRHLLRLEKTEYFLDIVKFYFGWLLAISASVLGWRAPDVWRSWRTTPRAGLSNTVRLSLVFLLPFVVSIGTSNAIYINMIFGLAPWFALFVLALRRLATVRNGVLFRQTATAVLSLFCAVHIVGGARDAPYRLSTGLGGQDMPTELGVPASKLKLDPAASKFFRDFRYMAAIHGFRAGDDLLAFYDLPGLVFAVGGRSPGLISYFGSYAGSQTVAEQALAEVGKDRVSRAFLVETPRSAEWLRGLGRLGIDFPRNYVLCGELALPYEFPGQVVRLWRPLGR